MYFSLMLANSADPDEMPHDAAFHLGLQYLQKYLVQKKSFLSQQYHILPIKLVCFRISTYSLVQVQVLQSF